MNIEIFKSLYAELPKDIFCKSLNCEIKITRAGFKHVFKERIRKGEDIKTRGLAIKYIPDLLARLNIYQQHTKKINSNGDISYWNLQGVVNNVCLHLTIRKIGNQNLHLYSWHWKGQSPRILK